jgi:hypothetical protein
MHLLFGVGASGGDEEKVCHAGKRACRVGGKEKELALHLTVVEELHTQNGTW